jgi:hypothetical protein
MQIVVSELPIEDAVERARTRFQRADEHLSRALAGSALLGCRGGCSACSPSLQALWR